MNKGAFVFIGVFLLLAASWSGLVLTPDIQYGRLEEIKVPDTGLPFPVPRSGLAEAGREVYRANGCIYCHSQQVRGGDFGADLARGWGQRRSVSRDYLRDKPVFLGTMRTGPDLTNIGLRQRSAEWHLSHLYDPQITSPGSVMPPFKFLFEQRPIRIKPSPNALKLTGTYAVPSGWEVVPKPEAELLVDYLLSLRVDAALPEAPLGK